MHPYKILIVDDNEAFVAALRYALEGCDIAWRETYIGCAEYLRLERPLPDLILLDLWLPDSPGHDTLAKIEILKHYRRPIIVMTGKGDQSIRAAALDAGAKDYCDKPIANLDDFLRKIETTIKQAELDRKLLKNSVDLSEAAAEVKRLLQNGAGNGR